jgi:hypothetical protein
MAEFKILRPDIVSVGNPKVPFDSAGSGPTYPGLKRYLGSLLPFGRTAVVAVTQQQSAGQAYAYAQKT